MIALKQPRAIHKLTCFSLETIAIPIGIGQSIYSTSTLVIAPFCVHARRGRYRAPLLVFSFPSLSLFLWPKFLFLSLQTFWWPLFQLPKPQLMAWVALASVHSVCRLQSCFMACVAVWTSFWRVPPFAPVSMWFIALETVSLAYAVSEFAFMALKLVFNSFCGLFRIFMQ